MWCRQRRTRLGLRCSRCMLGPDVDVLPACSDDRVPYTPAVTPYQPQADDTSAMADELQFAAWRRMTPVDKMRLWAAMQVAAWQLAESGIRTRHPQASDREVLLRRLALTLDAETMRRVFDWEPT